MHEELIDIARQDVDVRHVVGEGDGICTTPMKLGGHEMFAGLSDLLCLEFSHTLLTETRLEARLGRGFP